MNLISRALTILLLLCSTAFAGTIRGKVYDDKTGEPLIGVVVHLQDKDVYTTTGLDGSFLLKNIEAGTYKLAVSYLSYKTKIKEVYLKEGGLEVVSIKMEPDESIALNEVVVSERRNESSELTARMLERNSPQLMNIVSGRAIEISPDLTVANVLQRVSGISIERNSSGDGQYAILRGMDKRYNYTLVNGVKLPSPDNKYRYLPLDIFPAELMDRLEVYKTLTPNMEGDVIGGAVNMVMKDAPDQLQINTNIATGYSQIFMDRDYLGYQSSSIKHQSPYEQYGKNYQANSADFTNATIDYQPQNPAPNVVGGLSIGNRFFDKKFGVIIAGSYQNTYRGNNSDFFTASVVDVDKYATITNLNNRQYSEHQKRYGVHNKLDYTFNQNHKLQLYNAYMDLSTLQTRDIVSINFSSDYDAINGNAQLNYSTRSRSSQQTIFNSTLQGKHQFIGNKLTLKWSVVYSSATNKTPDNTTINLYGLRTNFVEKITTVDKSTRRWEHNNDNDNAAYLDLDYKTKLFSKNIVFSLGGLYRDKQRSNFYNNYELRPVDQTAVYGEDFSNYTEIVWNVQNPSGAVANALSYDASEKITAGYGMFKTEINKLKVTGGIRLENTQQGYKMLFPAGEPNPVGDQNYLDILPSANFIYPLTEKQNLHASYFRSVNRPGFFEIVPGKIVNE